MTWRNYRLQGHAEARRGLYLMTQGRRRPRSLVRSLNSTDGYGLTHVRGNAYIIATQFRVQTASRLADMVAKIPSRLSSLVHLSSFPKIKKQGSKAQSQEKGPASQIGDPGKSKKSKITRIISCTMKIIVLLPKCCTFRL